MSNINILFYSSKCKNCYNLMTLLNKIKILKNFKLIQIDNNPNIPSQIKTVPTMIVSGHPKMLVANEAIQWIKNLIQLKQNKILNQTKKQNNEPIGSEKNNFSDLFTYVDNNNISQNHNFSNPNQKITNIFTAPELDKMNNKELNKAIQNKLKTRQKQDRLIKQIVKK